MANHSLEAWKSWKQAQQKYDYYVVGLSSALFAYISTNTLIGSLSTPKEIIDFSSLFFIFVSVAYGILKIEGDLSIQSIDFRKAYAQDYLNVANEVLNSSIPVKNKDDGKIITVEEAQNWV